MDYTVEDLLNLYENVKPFYQYTQPKTVSNELSDYIDNIKDDYEIDSVNKLNELQKVSKNYSINEFKNYCEQLYINHKLNEFDELISLPDKQDFINDNCDVDLNVYQLIKPTFYITKQLYNDSLIFKFQNTVLIVKNNDIVYNNKTVSPQQLLRICNKNELFNYKVLLLEYLYQCRTKLLFSE